MRTQVEQRFENGDPVREYWLARGEGFAVETQRGRTVGRVVDVVLDAEEGKIGQIVVRTHGLRSVRGRTAEIPSGDVAAAVPSRRAFVLDGERAAPARVRRAARRRLRRVAAAVGRTGVAATRSLGLLVLLGVRYAWELVRALGLRVRHEWALARTRR